jgi:hypothetical protein
MAGLAGGLEQGLGQLRQGGAWVVVEAPGGLGGGLQGVWSGQVPGPGGDRVGVPGVLQDEPAVARLQALVEVRERDVHTLFYWPGPPFV